MNNFFKQVSQLIFVIFKMHFFCQPVPLFTLCYPPLLPLVTPFHPLLPVVTPCHPVSPLVTLCHPLSPSVTSCYPLLPLKDWHMFILYDISSIYI